MILAGNPEAMGRDCPPVETPPLPPPPPGGPEPVPTVVDYAAGPSEPEALVGGVCLASYGLAVAVMLLWAWSPEAGQVAAALALAGVLAAILRRR